MGKIYCKNPKPRFRVPDPSLQVFFFRILQQIVFYVGIINELIKNVRH